jgi:hypothetical protein
MEPIRVYHLKEKLLAGRDNFTVALFALGPYKNICEYVPELFELWLKNVPESALGWANVGMSGSAEPKPFRKTTLKRARNEIDPEKAKEKEQILLEILGGNEYCPDYYLSIFGSDDWWLADNAGTVIEMRFPSEFPSSFGFDAFVELTNAFADSVPYTSGYASPSLVLTHIGSSMRAAGKQLYPILKRYPGYDVSANNLARLGNKCRGARWLTLLGDPLVNTLTGKEAIASQLDPGIDLIPNKHGLLIRAGTEPELGDLERDEHPVLLRSVAKAIEPVTVFDEISPIANFVAPNKMEKEYARWARRFF